MSAPTRATPWAVRYSVWLYRHLLVAYPQAFRRQYGAQMVQVFRDCCRDATATEGNVGLLRYWLMALGDLVVSALAERRREELHMTRMFWIRLGSLAAIVGNALPALMYALYVPFGFALIYTHAPLLEQISIGLPHRLLSLVVAQWVLYLPALVGLQICSAGRTGVMGWIGFTTAVLGALIGCLGYTLYWIGWGVEISSTPIVTGSILLAVGMILNGIALLRARALPRLNWLPLILGITKLLIPADPFFVAHAFDLPDFIQVNLVYGFLGAVLFVASGLLPAIEWLLLGIALWPRRSEQVAVRDIPASIEPAI